MQIKGPIKVNTDSKSTAYQKLQEMILVEGKKVKLTIPFIADGFKSEKTPTQPDGITPIVVKEIEKPVNPVEINKPIETKIIEESKEKIKPKEIKTKKGGKK